MPRIDIGKVAEILKRNAVEPATLRRIVEEMDLIVKPIQGGSERSPEADLESIRSAIIEKERQARSYRLRGAVFAAFFATTIGAVLVTLIWNPAGDKSIPEQFGETSKVLVVYQNEIDALKAETTDLAKAMAVKPVPSSQEAMAAEEARVSSAVRELDARLTRLEIGIQETPEKALSLPLIRKDIGDLERQMVEFQGLNRSEMDRIHDEQKWILGGIGAVAAAVLAGSIKIILSSLPNKVKDD